jgi:hypothetical protein
MAGFPFKIGDLVSFKWPWASSTEKKDGIIISSLDTQRGGMIQYEILCEGKLFLVPKNQVSPAPVKKVSYKSGFLPRKSNKK